MIYLFTALYDEAYPFLQYYKMKKEINSLPFEIEKPDSIHVFHRNAPPMPGREIKRLGRL